MKLYHCICKNPECEMDFWAFGPSAKWCPRCKPEVDRTRSRRTSMMHRIRKTEAGAPVVDVVIYNVIFKYGTLICPGDEDCFTCSLAEYCDREAIGSRAVC